MTLPDESEPLLENGSQLEETQEQLSAFNSKDDGKFPWRQLSVLAFARLVEPIAFMSISSYSYVMVIHLKGPKNASFYSGLLISAFALAEALTAMLWGHLSDRFGRKPIILVALSGTALSSLLFGFAPNYWIALLARVVGGLLNGNLAVMQTMVAEIVTRPEHEPKAYAMQPFMWSVGAIAGAALGGYTAEPAVSYPNVFSKDGIFGKFPYLLPNLVAVGIIIAAIITNAILLKETNVNVKARRAAAAASSKITRRNSNENQPLLDDGAQNTTKRRRQSNASYIATTASIPNEPGFDITKPLVPITSIGTGTNNVAVFEDAAAEETETEDAPKIVAFNRDVVLWIIALVVMSYQQMAFNTLLSVYLLDKPHQSSSHLDLVGGLGKTLPEVGTYLAVDSLIAIVIQAFIFPPLVAKLGVYWSVLSCIWTAPIIHFIVPFVTLLPNPGVGLYVMMFLNNLNSIVNSTSLLILIKNAVYTPAVLGRVNGLAMALCSGARTVSPPLVGIIYSSLGSAAGWWSVAIVAAVGVVDLFFIRRPKTSNQTMLQKASAAA